MSGKVRMLWRITKGNRLGYAAAVAALVVGTLISYLVPLVIGVTIDSILGDKPLEGPRWFLRLVELAGGKSAMARNLWLCGLSAVVLTSVSGAMMYLRGRWAATASEAVTRRLRDRLYGHMQELPCARHDRMETGDLIQRCTSDVETVHLFLSQQVVEIGRATVLVVTVLPMMIALNVRMTLVSMILVPLILTYAVVFFRRVRGAFLVTDEAEASMTSALQENLTGIRVVRAFARQDFERNRFAGRNTEFRDRDYRLIRILSWFYSVSDLMCFSQRCLVLFAGAALVRQGQMTFGTLVAFYAYVDRFLWPVRQIGRVLTELGKAMVSTGRLQEVLDQPTEAQADGGADLARPVRGEIVVEGLHFAHGQSTPVLRGVSFAVRPGQVLAILGPSGSGKSTLVSLLLRFYDYQQGSIRLDGQELSGLNRKAVRSAIGAVLQEPFLYSRSVRDNILLGRGAATDEELVAAAAKAGIHDSILTFEKGYETIVGERGVTLSGGQRQRVALARAILGDPAVLVLDDALSAVDTRTEAMILDALEARRGRRTTLVIAHRLSTLRRADRILVLEAGRVVQDGTHESLLAQPGRYRQLWQIQSSLEEDLSREMETAG